MCIFSCSTNKAIIVTLAAVLLSVMEGTPTDVVSTATSEKGCAPDHEFLPVSILNRSESHSQLTFPYQKVFGKPETPFHYTKLDSVERHSCVPTTKIHQACFRGEISEITIDINSPSDGYITQCRHVNGSECPPQGCKVTIHSDPTSNFYIYVHKSSGHLYGVKPNYHPIRIKKPQVHKERFTFIIPAMFIELTFLLEYKVFPSSSNEHLLVSWNKEKGESVGRPLPSSGSHSQRPRVKRQEPTTRGPTRGPWHTTRGPTFTGPMPMPTVTMSPVITPPVRMPPVSTPLFTTRVMQFSQGSTKQTTKHTPTTSAMSASVDFTQDSQTGSSVIATMLSTGPTPTYFDESGDSMLIFIVIGVVAGLVFISIILLLVACLVRRSRSDKSSSSAENGMRRSSDNTPVATNPYLEDLYDESLAASSTYNEFNDGDNRHNQPTKEPHVYANRGHPIPPTVISDPVSVNIDPAPYQNKGTESRYSQINETKKRGSSTDTMGRGAIMPPGQKQTHIGFSYTAGKEQNSEYYNNIDVPTVEYAMIDANRKSSKKKLAVALEENEIYEGIYEEPPTPPPRPSNL